MNLEGGVVEFRGRSRFAWTGVMINVEFLGDLLQYIMKQGQPSEGLSLRLM